MRLLNGRKNSQRPTPKPLYGADSELRWSLGVGRWELSRSSPASYVSYNQWHMAGPGHLALAPEIDAFRREFERLSLEADALVTPLTDAQFHWRPSLDGWSVAQCLEHLNVTARLYLGALDEGIADAIRRGLYGAGPYRYLWTGRLLTWTQQPPPRWRTRTRPTYQPPADRPRHETMAAFRAYQVQYVDRLRQANGLDLARARVASPAGRWMPMSLGSGFALMIVHEQRHLWQARAVTAAASFPGSA
jgi:hypothetical protein